MSRIAAAVAPGRSVEQAADRARFAEEIGCDSVWINQLPSERDASLVLTTYARVTQRVGLGTFVLPIYTRHPTAMAQMTATLDELSGGRFRLGIGVGHKVSVEGLWGLRFERTAEAMREYLTIVRSLLVDGTVELEGAQFTSRAAYTAPRRADVPILVAGLGPRMLDLAGELSTAWRSGCARRRSSPARSSRGCAPRASGWARRSTGSRSWPRSTPA